MSGPASDPGRAGPAAKRAEQPPTVPLRARNPCGIVQRMASGKRLYRSRTDRLIGGVCGGMAEYLGIDPVLVRVLWVVLALSFGAGILAYVLLWLVTPEEPREQT